MRNIWRYFFNLGQSFPLQMRNQSKVYGFNTSHNQHRLKFFVTTTYESASLMKNFGDIFYLSSSWIVSPRCIIPPCATDAYTPTCISLYLTTVFKIPKSRGKVTLWQSNHYTSSVRCRNVEQQSDSLSFCYYPMSQVVIQTRLLTLSYYLV